MKLSLMVAAAAFVVAAPVFADHRELPSGTEVSVRVNESINATDARAGQTFSAVVDRDVKDPQGVVIIPKGSDAQLMIERLSTDSGKEFALNLNSVTVDGRRYVVSTDDVTRERKEGLGKNKRTAKYTGGGAAIGAVIGAIAGGGKGAAIGAATGAAAGAATQVMTRGKEIRVPAESLLTFKLDRDTRLETR